MAEEGIWDQKMWGVWGITCCKVRYKLWKMFFTEYGQRSPDEETRILPVVWFLCQSNKGLPPSPNFCSHYLAAEMEWFAGIPILKNYDCNTVSKQHMKPLAAESFFLLLQFNTISSSPLASCWYISLHFYYLSVSLLLTILTLWNLICQL